MIFNGFVFIMWLVYLCFDSQLYQIICVLFEAIKEHVVVCLFREGQFFHMKLSCEHGKQHSEPNSSSL